MKKIFSMMLLLGAATMTFVSCDPATEGKEGDKTELTALLAECQTLADSATTEDYPQTVIDDFKEVIAIAVEVNNDPTADQTEVDNTITNLETARKTFLESAYDAIPSANLLVGLSFDEGTETTTQLTAEGKNLIAKLNSGFKAGSGKPTFVTGHNDKGKAAHFTGTSNMSIDEFNQTDFTGSKLSFAAWVNPDSAKADNYFLSYNSWHTWKLQLQDGGKPFFTVSTDKGATDIDNETDGSVPAKRWTHVVVTYNSTDGTVVFYVNGAPTRTWTSAEKPNLQGSIVVPTNPCAITIGSAYKTLEEAIANDWDGHTAESYLPFFDGALDEVKIYNVALTAGQVAKLYDDEK